VPLDKKLGGPPEVVWTLQKDEKCLPLARNRPLTMRLEARPYSVNKRAYREDQHIIKRKLLHCRLVNLDLHASLFGTVMNDLLLLLLLLALQPFCWALAVLSFS
jgi:hypothetical protein